MDQSSNNPQTMARISDIINKNNAGVIILPINPSFDTLAAGTSLYLSLLKMGKTVTLVCSSQVNEDLVAIDKIQNNFSINGNSLVISFPYSDGAIDKVDYNIQGENFNLIISPRPGSPKLNQNQVKYSYSGGNFQFIIVIDSPSLNRLGEIYTNNQNQFQGKDIINIDRHLTNSQYGTVNLVNKTISSISQLVFKIIQSLDIVIDKDIATNLYTGIVTSTNNFTSYSVNADTFEASAQLLRIGAVKKPFKRSVNQSIPRFVQTGKPRESQPTKPIELVEKEPIPDEKPTTPQDWLKPKIFKGGGLI